MSARLQRSGRVSYIVLAFILALTVVLALALSRHKLLNQDEVFVLQTDTVPAVAQLLDIQLHTPISLDPPVYHLLAHAATRLFGPTPFALRLPSLFGYLLMQLCLFLYVSRAAGERAGLLAAALPALTATLFYAAEARPYGLLLGLFALTLTAYQSSTRSLDEPTQFAPHSRLASLLALALAIALTLNTHYFGVLLLVPVYAAEFTRTITRRKLDKPVAAAILAGTLAFAFTIPFQRAAAVFHRHYYNLANASPRAITQAYRSLFVDYTQTSLHTQRLIAIGFVLFALCFLAALTIRWRTLHLPAAEAAFLLALAALPFFGYLLAHFVTHSIEVRYVLGAIVAIVVLAALLTAPLLEDVPAFSATLAIVALAIVATGALRIRSEAHRSAATLASLRIPPELEAMLRADPRSRIYVQEVGRFEESRYNTRDPLLRTRLSLVYSVDREIRFDGHDTEALTAEHLSRFSSLPIVDYGQLLADPSPHIVLIDPRNGWQWIDRAFPEDNIVTTPIAPWFGGELTTAVRH
jgi:4-amino-4-deoxy-L-arabinose transferase-like glycosyltransferase